MKSIAFWISAAVILLLGFGFTKLSNNEFYFFAIYTIMQGVIMAVAWNILGGFTGYVNFGSAGFFAVGVYTSVSLNKAFGLPLAATLVIAGIIGGLLGLAAGYLSLRLKGVYFAIATLAIALVLETVVNNWHFVGGAAGTYIIPPTYSFIFDNFIELLFMLMLVLAIAATAISRYISSSRLGMGLAAIRDDETAAECMGVPTLRLKLISTTTMGVLMSVAGAPYPFFVSFVELCEIAFDRHGADIGFLPACCGQRHRHADDRRHRGLVRSGDRRPGSGDHPGDHNGHDFVGAQPVDCRCRDGGVHHACAQGDRRAGGGLQKKEGRDPWLIASWTSPI